MIKQLALKTKKVDLKTRYVSDHCPVIWHSKDISKICNFWRINEDLLDKQEMVVYLKKEIDVYFKLNETPEVKYLSIWDAFKVVIRGLLIQANMAEKKKKEEGLKQLYQDLEKTEQVLKRRPGKKNLGKKKDY